MTCVCQFNYDLYRLSMPLFIKPNPVYNGNYLDKQQCFYNYPGKSYNNNNNNDIYVYSM